MRNQNKRQGKEVATKAEEGVNLSDAEWTLNQLLAGLTDDERAEWALCDEIREVERLASGRQSEMSQDDCYAASISEIELIVAKWRREQMRADGTVRVGKVLVNIGRHISGMSEMNDVKKNQGGRPANTRDAVNKFMSEKRNLRCLKSHERKPTLPDWAKAVADGIAAATGSRLTAVAVRRQLSGKWSFQNPKKVTGGWEAVAVKAN